MKDSMSFQNFIIEDKFIDWYSIHTVENKNVCFGINGIVR